MKYILSSVCLLSLSTSISAGELYVQSGASGDCSAIAPCGVIQQAINVASAGDVINIGEGDYTENLTIPRDKAGLIIRGEGDDETRVISAGADLLPKFAPAHAPADIIIDVFAPNVSISKLAVVHPEGIPTKRDIGFFFRPPAVNGRMHKCRIERQRTGELLEPTTPGSRGVLVFRATGIEISKNEFSGNYEDHIHLPTSASLVEKNEIEGATRIGIVVIQESETSLSVNNVIRANEVEKSVSDGIQIQGDNNLVSRNEVEENGGIGIHLCGPTASPACVAPGGSATASNNLVKKNDLEDNADGNIIDDGSGNILNNN